MQEFLDILASSKLFDQISKIELLSLLTCLDAKEVVGQKDQIIHSAEEILDYVGIVVCGKIFIKTKDSLSVESQTTVIKAGEMFGATIACCNRKHLPITIFSDFDTVVIKIKVANIVQPCSNACKFHAKIIMNLLTWMATKHIELDTKLQVITKRSIKDKAVAYLQSAALAQQRNQFEIPYNRQQLADYLCVDRSSLSFELGKLKECGAIDFRKNVFTILDLSKI